ncbi:hypothetical protein VTH06DRAFT_2025 [Thermothelomyces fergusii]
MGQGDRRVALRPGRAAGDNVSVWARAQISRQDDMGLQPARLHLGGRNFRLYCNKDVKNQPLLALFTADFATCIDSCAAYTKYVSSLFGGVTANTSLTVCAAVSFVPAWTDRAVADKRGARGNCYLKGGPPLLKTPDIGTDCHSAIYLDVE